MKTTLAQFKTLGPYPLTLHYGPDMESHTDAIRTTEYVEIEFPERAREELVPAQVAVIDKKIAEISEEFGRKLAALKEAKDNLLALTMDPA